MATLNQRKEITVNKNSELVNVIVGRFDDKLKSENANELKFLVNTNRHLDNISASDLNLITDAINKKAKLSVKFKDPRKAIIAGLVNDDGSLVDDPKQIELGKQALVLHNNLLSALIACEKQQLAADWAAERGVTVDALVDSLTPMELRKYVGQTAGCDEANKVKKALANALDLKVKKGVDAGLINKEEAAKLKLSILLNDEGELDLLPREIRKADNNSDNKGADNKSDKKGKVSNVDKILSDILKLSNLDKVTLLNKLANNSNEDRDLIIAAAAVATELENKIEDTSEKIIEDLEADIRVLDLELKNGDKGTKKLGDKEKANIKTKRDELATRLAELKTETPEPTKH